VQINIAKAGGYERFPCYLEEAVIAMVEDAKITSLWLQNCIPSSHEIGDEFRCLTHLKYLERTMLGAFGRFYGLGINASFWTGLETLIVDGYGRTEFYALAPCTIECLSIRNNSMQAIPDISNMHCLNHAGLN